MLMNRIVGSQRLDLGSQLSSCDAALRILTAAAVIICACTAANADVIAHSKVIVDWSSLRIYPNVGPFPGPDVPIYPESAGLGGSGAEVTWNGDVDFDNGHTLPGDPTSTVADERIAGAKAHGHANDTSIVADAHAVGPSGTAFIGAAGAIGERRFRAFLRGAITYTVTFDWTLSYRLETHVLGDYAAVGFSWKLDTALGASGMLDISPANLYTTGSSLVAHDGFGNANEIEAWTFVCSFVPVFDPTHPRGQDWYFSLKVESTANALAIPECDSVYTLSLALAAMIGIRRRVL